MVGAVVRCVRLGTGGPCSSRRWSLGRAIDRRRRNRLRLNYFGGRLSTPADTEPEVGRPELGYREIVVEGGATVTGRVRFRGRVPYVSPLPVLRRHEVCGTFKPAASFRLDRSQRALSDAVVSLEGVASGRAVEPRWHDVEISECEIRPPVLVVAVGDSLRLTSKDATIHALVARSGAGSPDPVFQHPFPGPASHLDWQVESGGRIDVHCRAGHPWERLEIHRFDHPYATQTDEEGRFELLDVPPGRYELVVSHHGFPTDQGSSGRPRLGDRLIQRQAVSVEAGSEVVVDVDLFSPRTGPALARARR